MEVVESGKTEDRCWKIEEVEIWAAEQYTRKDAALYEKIKKRKESLNSN